MTYINATAITGAYTRAVAIAASARSEAFASEIRRIRASCWLSRTARRQLAHTALVEAGLSCQNTVTNCICVSLLLRD